MTGKFTTADTLQAEAADYRLCWQQMCKTGPDCRVLWSGYGDINNLYLFDSAIWWRRWLIPPVLCKLSLPLDEILPRWRSTSPSISPFPISGTHVCYATPILLITGTRMAIHCTCRNINGECCLLSDAPSLYVSDTFFLNIWGIYCTSSAESYWRWSEIVLQTPLCQFKGLWWE